ncbi:hypothetical protein QQ045_031595 [Rhodiola kirilowii]
MELGCLFGTRKSVKKTMLILIFEFALTEFILIVSIFVLGLNFQVFFIFDCFSQEKEMFISFGSFCVVFGLLIMSFLESLIVLFCDSADLSKRGCDRLWRKDLSILHPGF